MKRKRKNKPIPFEQFIIELKLEEDPVQAHFWYVLYCATGLSFEEWNNTPEKKE